MNRLTLLAVALFALAGCATGPMVDYDDEVDFSNYRTFALMDPPPAPPDRAVDPIRSELNLRRLEESIREELGAHGFQESTSGEPDFVVGYAGGTQERTEIYSTYGGGYYRYHWDRIESYTYTQGTLILDILDGKERRLVWRGWVTEVVSSPENAGPQIRAAVKKIFSAFPPGVAETK